LRKSGRLVYPLPRRLIAVLLLIFRHLIAWLEVIAYDLFAE